MLIERCFTAMRANASLRRIRRIKLRHLRLRIKNSDLKKLSNHRALSYKVRYGNSENSNEKRNGSKIITKEGFKFDKEPSVILRCKDCLDCRGYFLLILFVNYSRTGRKNGYCFGCIAKKFKKWIDLVELNFSDDFWYFSNTLDVRVRLKLKLTDVNLDEVEQMNNEVFFAAIAYKLKSVLPILINCKDDVNFQDKNCQTILHIFLEQYRKVTDKSPEGEFRKFLKFIKFLIKNGASLYTVDKSGKMPFETATECKNTKIMQMIVSCLNVYATDHHGNTALHSIINECINEQLEHKNESLHLVKILISRGANANLKNNRGLTPVHLAAAKFHIDILKFFEDVNADFVKLTEDGKTCLHILCQSTSDLQNTSKISDTCEFLVNKNCNVDAVDNEGYTSLHYAAQFATTGVIEKLIKLGANKNHQTQPHMITPLYLAAKSDKIENMKKLISLGADVNLEAADGSTPIFMAVMWGSLETTEYLISQGADLYRREQYFGFTLLHIAAHDQTEMNERANGESQFHLLVEKDFDVNDSAFCGVMPIHLALITRNTDFVKILVEKGVDINFQSDAVEWTALHMAAIKKDLSTIKFLVEKGIDVNCRVLCSQTTPLHLALMLHKPWGMGRLISYRIERKLSLIIKFWSGKQYTKSSLYREVVIFLLDNGTDVKARDDSGRTPLHWAMLQPFIGVTQKILDSGVHVNLEDNERKTPVHYILEKGNSYVFKLLIDYGVDINDDDTCEMILKSNEEIQNLAIQQAIKLKLIGLPISKKYERFICAPEFELFYIVCADEAKALVDHGDEEFSLYKFLHMSKIRQYQLTKKIQQNYPSLQERFPLYSTLIQAVCKEAINWMLLTDDAINAWNEISPFYLPYVCVNNILSYLNNRSLDLLVASVKIDEHITIVQGHKRAIKGAGNIVF